MDLAEWGLKHEVVYHIISGEQEDLEEAGKDDLWQIIEKYKHKIRL